MFPVVLLGLRGRIQRNEVANKIYDAGHDAEDRSRQRNRAASLHFIVWHTI